jgi:hypothetical protein
MVAAPAAAAQIAGEKPRIETSDGPAEHRVKCWPEFFEAILSGFKTHDLRRADDRKFKVGDYLRLQEFDADANQYTGRELTVKITYITSADNPCAFSKEALNPSFCILSIKKL